MCVPEKFEDLQMFISPDQMSECTGIHVKTIRRCLKNGTIPGKKVGSRWLIYKYVLLDESWEAVLANGAESDRN